RQDVPIEAVIDAVATDRDPSRMPLFQAQLSLQNVPITAGAVSGLRVEPMRMDRVAAKNDLSFILDSRGDEGIGAEVEFNTDLFRQETIEDLWSDYVGLLKQLAGSPDAVLTGLLRTPGVIEGPKPAPTRNNLVSWFDAVAERQPDAEAVCDDTTSLTFAGLRERAEAIADALGALALPPAAPVAVLTGRSVELITSVLGVLKSGAPYVPLSPDHPEERLRFMLSHAGARAIVTDASCEPLAARLASACGAVVIRADVERSRASVARTPTAPADLAYIIFTSGSTGRPKGVMIEHRSVVNLVDGLGDLAYDTPGRRLRVALIASPVFDASVQQIFGTLLHGHTLCIVPDEARRDGARLGSWLDAMRVDASDGTPTLLRLLVDTGFGLRPTTLRHMLIGGEPLPSDLVAALHATPGGRDIVVTNVYGPTECCVDVVARRLTATDAPMMTAVVPIGRPMPGCVAAIVDAEGRLVPAGIPGELVIGGECVGRGYVNDPALTGERFVRLPGTGDARVYRTGDLCRLRRDGDIEFLGRNDDQVKVLGHRIELGEVEHHLRAHPAIAAVSVQARQTRKGHRELVAYIVARGRLEAIELRAFAAARMPAYMIPAYFVPLETLPVNASGKVSRQELPDPETATLLPSGAEYREAATEAEAALVSAWTHTLNRAPDGVRDNYFTSGGDSIKALQLASRLRDAGWTLEIRDLFKHPTIEQLAPHLQRRQSAPVADEPRSGRAPLGAIQRFFFDTYGPATAFNQAILLKVQRPLDASRLEAACAALMAHHGMLRCRFVREGSGWVQEVLEPSACRPRVERIDLRTSAAPADDLARHAAAEQLRFRLEQAPLWSAVLYDVPDGQRLLLTAHHLIVDGVSWR
ncbi:MAG: amino acid adenylation domain-containing protein, partial [Vicinamibacterales bacterium]